jgi:hypothetical protein
MGEREARQSTLNFKRTTSKKKTTVKYDDADVH